MSQSYEEYTKSYLAGEIELPESAVSNLDGTVKYNMDWHTDKVNVYNPNNPDYSVTAFENDSEVLNAFEIVTEHLAENRGIGSALFDPATAGEQTDISEFMRDDEFRIGTKVIKASILEDAPEEVKAAYRLMQTRWEDSSISDVGETFKAIKDYSTDAIFNTETLGSVAAALFTRGKSIPADVARRTAGKEAFKKAIKGSAAVASKNPLTTTAIVAGAYGGADNLAFQEMDIALGEQTGGYDLSKAAKAAGVTALFGVGLHGATRVGSKYFSKGTNLADEIEPTPEMLDQADLPESAGQIINNINSNTDVETLNISKFATDIGGGEQTKEEIKDAIRLAIAQETTAEGVRNKTKQALFKAATIISGNLVGKAAGVLSPYTAKSATAKILQPLLSNEFGIEYKMLTPQQKIVGQDLSEVQREVTGGFSEKFRAIVEDISLHAAKGTLAEDINELLMLSLRGNKAATSKFLDEDTAGKINTAAKGIRDLYKEMGNRLKDIGVIDKLVPNYIPRMWDRSAIEANPEKLAKLLESKGGYDEGTGMQTVQDMLSIKDQIDAGGSGGHFFSAKRKLNELENDADFQEFLNDDVLGSLHAYTFQAGKSIAKHRVLGVNTLADFQKVWTSRIQQELSVKGEKLSGSEIERINLLYKTATGEGMERYGKAVQNGVDAYGFVNRIGMLGFATVSSLTEVFLNMSKAGVINSVKGFGEALEISFKGITKDLESNLRTNHGLTAKEAFSEMRKYSIAMDQAMAQQGNRLAGDDLMNETLQNASNKFFRYNLLDQWTKFVQTTSYASGKNLITDNLKVLASYGGDASSKRFKTRAGELAELGIDYKEGLKWLSEGSKKTDSFYDKSVLGGAARYSNSIILQPTAMSGLKPLLHSNPKTAIAFQLLGYPVAFTNTILKGATKALVKDPVRNSGRMAITGLIMTEMARATNYWRTDGRSEQHKTTGEIYTDAITRWGGNGILLDSIQRARESSMYVKNSAPYMVLPFGPIGSDAIKFYQQGLIPLLGGKVPFLSGSYKSKEAIDFVSDNTPLDLDGDYVVADYKDALKEMQRKVSDFLVKKPNKDQPSFGYKKGGEVVVPNAPAEPDERIDKVTGKPYNQQAGSAFMDEEDPLKVMMNSGGKVKRKKYVTGAVVKGSTKLASALAESLSNKVDNYFKPEAINTAANNINKQVADIGIDPNTPEFNNYVGALIDNNLETDDFRSIAELEKVPEWVEAMTNQDMDKQAQLWDQARRVLGVSETKIEALEKIQKLQPSIDPLKALESVMPSSLGNLSSEYRRIRPEGETGLFPQAKHQQIQKTEGRAARSLERYLAAYIRKSTEGLSEEGVDRLAAENVRRILSSDDPSIAELDLNRLLKRPPVSDLDFSNLEEVVGKATPGLNRDFFGLDGLLRENKDVQKILKKANLLNEAIEYSDNSYGTLSKELDRDLKKLYFQNKVATALEDAGYNPKKLDRWGLGLERTKDGVTFSETSPVGFYSLAEKAAKELNRKEGTGNEWVKELAAKGVKEDELNWTGFIEQFTGSNQGEAKVTKNEVTKFLRDNRLDVNETQLVDDFKRYTVRGQQGTTNYRTVLLRLPRDKQSPAGKYTSEAHYPGVDNPIVSLRFSDSDDSIFLSPNLKILNLIETLDYDSAIIKDYADNILDMPGAISMFRRMSETLGFRGERGMSQYTDNQIKEAIDYSARADFPTKAVRKKNLILEEYQSDVHMQGEKVAYTNDPLKIKDKAGDLDGDANDVANMLDQEIEMLEDQAMELAEFDVTDTDIADIEVEISILQAQRELITGGGPVPEMPFKSKRGGGGWRELGVRRALIEAAKGDYDSLIIPTGKEQIRRYQGVFNPIENPTEQGLRKNPEAMVKNYDKVLVKLLNNFAKKYKEEVTDIGETGYKRELTITPEMKDDILRGLPQFYAGGLMKRKAFRTGGKVLNTLRRARN